jgi:hypothetical protein
VIGDPETNSTIIKAQMRALKQLLLFIAFFGFPEGHNHAVDKAED